MVVEWGTFYSQDEAAQLRSRTDKGYTSEEIGFT